MENDYFSINFREDINQKNLFILLISGLGHEHQADSYILLNDSFNTLNICGVTSKKRDFFINELTNSCIDFLEKKSIQFTKKILITHSMGGYFGFYINKYIDFDLYFICSPYISLDRKELNLNENENTHLENQIQSHNIESYCVDKIKIENISIKNQEKFIIVLDPESLEDQKQFYILRNKFPSVNIILIPRVGHLSLYAIEKERIISNFITENINKEIDKYYIESLISTVLNWALQNLSNNDAKIFILNQIYYNKKEKINKHYFDFVFGINHISVFYEYFFILDKYGRILNFCLSKNRYQWVSNPFNKSEYLPVFIKEHCNEYSECSCFINGNFIEMNSDGLQAEIHGTHKNYIKIPINLEILNKIYSNIDFESKINLLSVFEYNKKIIPIKRINKQHFLKKFGSLFIKKNN